MSDGPEPGTDEFGEFIDEMRAKGDPLFGE